MDLRQYGASDLENKALERALRRRKDKANHHKTRERPLLTRANAIRREEELEALRPHVAVVPPPQQRLSEVKKKEVVDKDKKGALVEESKTANAPQEREDVHPLELKTDTENGPDSSPPSPLLFPHSPFDTPRTNYSTSDEEDEDCAPLRDHHTRPATGEPLLNSAEVRKYFGYSALDSFSQKVSFVNKQQHLVFKCPPLNLKSTANTSRSISSANSTKRPRKKSASSLLSASRSSKASTAKSGLSISPDLLTRPDSRQRGGRDRHLVRTQSKIYHQLRNLTNAPAPAPPASPSVSVGNVARGATDQRKRSILILSNWDESSLLSDVTGGEFISDLTSVANLEELKERREGILTQRLFADTGGEDIHKDEQYHTVEPSVMAEVQASPRSTYIMGCLSDNLNPRGSHIVRKKITDELHLEHHGMGDLLIEHLSTSLQFLPHVTSINIADNNLTDWGLVTVLSTIINCKHLLFLDMSDNVIGTDTADALASYLRTNPSLQHLILSNTDIDDFEGEMFVKAIQHSTNLVELNLSKNDLGNQELLNGVRPNIITAPEELASLLSESHCPLREINLAWNVIRLDSAVTLAQALSINESLIFLDLSYNCIGPEGGKAIGESLFENRTLQTLLLANNSIDSTSCFIICAAIQQNFALTRLSMDGNPVGAVGAKALMNIPSAVGSRLTLTADKSNVQFRSKENIWFEEDDPCGKYSLDMSDSFSRAVAFKLLTIAANHYSYDIKKCSYSERKESRDKIPIFLEQSVTDEKFKHMTPKEKKILQNLMKLKDSAEDMSVLTELFYEYDFNKSGTLEHFELKILLDDLGLELADNQIENAMTFIDIDKSGSIDLSEFVHFMQQYREDVMERIHDMTEGVVMSEIIPGEGDDYSSEGSVGSQRCLRRRNSRYIPPKTGFLHIELVDTYLKKAKFTIITEVDCSNIIDIASKIGHTTTMITFSLHSAKLRFNEALKLFDVMFHDVGNKAEVLLTLLPKMIYPMEARILVSRVTNEDPVEIEFVKQKLGSALRPIFGLPCGYYTLDLSSEIDRIALIKLFEVSIALAARRKEESDPFDLGVMGDTSQLRNRSSFRNVMYNEEAFVISPEVFTPLPREGMLEFDFVAHDALPSGVQVITDEKLTQILINTSLLDVLEKEDNFKWLKQSQKLANKCQGANGKLIYQCNPETAAEIGATSSDFYDLLIERRDYLDEGVKREEIKIDFSSLPRKQPKLARLASMTNDDPLMRQVGGHGFLGRDPMMMKSIIQNHRRSENYLPDKVKVDTESDLEEAEFRPNPETFNEKFKEFIHRPLGKQQQKLLEANMAKLSDEKPFTQHDIVSDICSQHITRTEVFVRKNKSSLMSPSPPAGGLLSPVPTAAKTEKKKSRKGEIVNLPSIVVMKNNKPVVLPAMSFPKEEEKEEKDEDNIDKALSDNFEETKNDSEKDGTEGGETTPAQLTQQRTRARMFSSSNLVHGMGNLSTEYNEHQKRINLLTKNRRRMRKLAQAMQVSRHAKASRLLSMLVDFMGIYWVKCRHVANVLHQYVMGMENKADYFGTYRVEFIVTMFSKIVDIHNFDLIFKELDAKEQGCLYCRLGWLNLFNPARPERSYELNMAIWEERMIAKALLHLAQAEGGDNVGQADFRWSRDVPRMPGWVVTKPWLSDHTMQRKGLLSLTYISVKDNYKLVPNVAVRKSLLHMVLACEKDMVPDVEDNVAAAEDKPAHPVLKSSKPVVLEGTARMLQDEELWTSYFYGDKNVTSRITRVKRIPFDASARENKSARDVKSAREVKSARGIK